MLSSLTGSSRPLAPAAVRHSWLAPLVLVLCLAGAARGQDDERPAMAHVEAVSSVTSDARPEGIFGRLNAPPVHVELSLDRAFHTPWRDYPGSFTTTRDRVFVGTWVPLPSTFLFGLDIEAEGSTYDGSWAFVFGNDHLYRTLWQIDVGPKLIDRVNDRLTFYMGTVFFFAGALDAEVQDSFRFELDLAAQYKLTPEVTLTVGAGMRTGIEARPSFYPIAGVEWPRFKAFLEGGILKATALALENAPGVRELDFFASFGIDLRQYRLAEYSGHRLAEVPGGVIRDTRFPLSVGTTYKPIAGLGLELTGGANFWQKIEVDDHLGRALGRGHASPAPFVALRLVIDI